MGETRNIIILGASFAGLGTAHYFIKHLYHKLGESAHATTRYKVILIDQSSHFFFRVAAPRACVNTTAIPHHASFTSIRECLSSYDQDAVEFIHGTISRVDTHARTVTYVPHESPAFLNALDFYSLVIATGTSTPTRLNSLHGDYTSTRDAFDSLNKRLPFAEEIVIVGGGPVGVETAGEIGELLNGVAGRFSNRPANERARITLVAGDGKLLPVLRQGLSLKAEDYLRRVGVDVLYDTRVVGVNLSASDAQTLNLPVSFAGDKTVVQLDSGETLTADVYIPATGVTPNTSYLPKAILDEEGSVYVNTQTLRVDGAGPRIYCVGDCGAWKRGGLLVIQAAIPVLCRNIAFDLSVPGIVPPHPHEEDQSETQLVPVGRKMGVGAFKGVRLPTFMVSLIKGRDFFLSRRFDTTHGKAYVKA